MRGPLARVLVVVALLLVGGCQPGPEAPSTSPSNWTVEWVIDGDTVDVRGPDGTDDRVRVIGIDTPERDECGYAEAADAMAGLVEGREVELVPGARDDRDRYDRLLRYLDVDGTDAGLRLIEQGLADARYDSRDGHGRHDREKGYIAADAASQPSPCR